MKEKHRSLVVYIVLMLVMITGGSMVASGAEVRSKSINIVGSVGNDTQRVESVSGMVVQLRDPGGFSNSIAQAERVTLKGVYFQGEFGFFRGMNTVLYDWIISRSVDLSGGVEHVFIEGRRIGLSEHSFSNGCLVTKEYGSLPIAFAPDGVASSTNVGYRCALAFRDEQLARLRKQLSPDPSVSAQQAEGSTQPNTASQTIGAPQPER